MTGKATELLTHYFVAAELARAYDEPALTSREPPTPSELAAELRAGRAIPDPRFDRLLPDELVAVSRRYWTPLRVVLQVADWLEELGVRSVVDLGSGAGKFCVAGALRSSATFTGVEHRPRLVAAARDLARVLAVDDRVSFVEGTLDRAALPSADAYYLFNPFGENLYAEGERLDDDVELDERRFRHDVAATEALLERTPVGTYVVTYNGFGGQMPLAFHQVRLDRTLPNMLRLWHKRTVPRASAATPHDME